VKYLHGYVLTTLLVILYYVPVGKRENYFFKRRIGLENVKEKNNCKGMKFKRILIQFQHTVTRVAVELI
jgi:hypothetical protein